MLIQAFASEKVLLSFTDSLSPNTIERVRFCALNWDEKELGQSLFSLFVGGELKFQFNGTQHGSVIPLLFLVF